MSFNESQSIAIHHKNGPMLVLAGPGSGKTLVITHRTKFLIEKWGVSPEKILVITFTKAAAGEMKERFKKLMGDCHLPVSFGTFHAVFFSILKHAYHFHAGNILRESERIGYLKEIIGRLELEIEDETDFISGITNEISTIKNERISLDYYYSVNCSEEIFRKIYRAYEERLRRANQIDFDDMLVLCYELLTERQDILKMWQKKFTYILIDEFQDINQIQYDIIKMLAGTGQNLFIVGDDDQSIYRFRGSRPEIMLNFGKEYPNAKTVLLNINYRCTASIVKGSLSLIKNNKNRFFKEIQTVRGKGEKIIIRDFKEQREENQEIVHNILEEVKQGESFSDMAILFRTNTQPGLLIEKLMEYNIPFKMKDGIPNIYEHWITKNLISYIKIAMGSRERKEFLQIMNRPKRYIKREYLEEPEISFDSLLYCYRDKDWMYERIVKLQYDIQLLSKRDPYSAINYIRKGIGYEEYLKEYAEFRKIKSEELLEVLDEVQESARGFKTYEEWFSHMEEYKEELQRQERNKEQITDSVSLSTMHSAKGLEYKTVFIIDANEGITPHRKAFTEADMEEERRMFYVAITRAKEKLFIYTLKERYHKKLEPSRFVSEILTDKEELKPGALVEHKKYKKGIIKGTEGNKLVIYFYQSGKTLVLDRDFCIANGILHLTDEKG